MNPLHTASGSRSGLTPDLREAVVLLPAFNEEECIGAVVSEIYRSVGDIEVVVINDGSIDGTAAAARASGATVLDLPCNLGVGDAVQTGFRYAFERGFRYAVRCDADGQHSPADIPVLLEALRSNPGIDLIIGSRYLGEESFSNTLIRNVGIFFLSSILSLSCRKKITDPTSGFQALNRHLLFFFSSFYPKDYPEPEALALLRRQGYDFMEVPATFRERQGGRSSIRKWGTLYYAFKVFLALLVDRARPIDTKYARWNLKNVIREDKE